MLSRLISSLQHPIVKKTIKLKQEKKFRDEEGLIVVTGDKMIRELSHSFSFELLLYLDTTPLPKEIRSKEFIPITAAVLNRCLGYTGQDHWIAWIKKPENSSTLLFPCAVLDSVQDPGNLGTLLRSALAFKIQTVILLDGSADPFNDKALKSGKGAAFHLNIQSLSTAHFLSILDQTPHQIFYADAQGEDFQQVTFPSHTVLILGNEGHGVRPDLKTRGHPLGIPMESLSESLNVSIAGSILFYHLYRQLYG